MPTLRRPFSPVFRLLLIVAGPAFASIPRSASAPTHLLPIVPITFGVPAPAVPASLPPSPAPLAPLPMDPDAVLMGWGVDPLANLLPTPRRRTEPLGLDQRDPWDPACDLTMGPVLAARPMLTSDDAADLLNRTRSNADTARYVPSVSLDPSDPWGN